MLGNIADTKQREAVAALQSALQSGNEEEGKKAWGQVIDAITEKVKTDFEMYSTDTNVLAQRGYRQLTSEETKFYQNLAKAGKASDPKQAFTDLINTDGGMPETIIEDVYRDLLEEHPLLDKITFQNVKYLTKWLLNDHTRQKAAWGQINGEITQEIESAFKGVEVALLKLTAYAVIPQDMLDLGPSFLDNYIRTILKEALYAALEKAIVSGSGKDEPVGLNREIHEGGSACRAAANGRLHRPLAVRHCGGSGGQRQGRASAALRNDTGKARRADCRHAQGGHRQRRIPRAARP